MSGNIRPNAEPAATAVVAGDIFLIDGTTGVRALAATAVAAVAAGKTAKINNSITLAGTDATTMTFPITSATIARIDAAQTFVGTQTIGALVATTLNGNTITAGSGVLTIAAGKTLTVSNSLTLAGTDSTVQTFPSTSGTVVTSVSVNAVTNAMRAQMAAFTLKGNATSGTANEADITIDGLTLKGTPASADEIMIWDVAGSALKKVTITSLALGTGVSSLNAQTGAISLITQPQGRLTLTSGVAITATDVTAATSLFYTASAAPVSDATNAIPNAAAQLSIALDSTAAHPGYHQGGRNFDVFKFNDSGTIRIGTGPIWNAGAVVGTDTARGTGAGSTDLQLLGNTGLLVNTNSIVLRWGNSTGNTTTMAAGTAVYLGTIRTTADGQTEDSLAKRFVWNAYNQVWRDMRITDATTSWNYSTGTVRQMNANTANQLAFVTGANGTVVDAELNATAQSSTATPRSVNFGVGIDSIIAYSQLTSIISINNAGFASSISKYRGKPGLGYHFAAALETGAGTDTQTWFGSPFMQLTGALLA